MVGPSSQRATKLPAGSFRSAQRGQGAHPLVVAATLVALAGAIIFFVVRVMIANEPPVEPPKPVEVTTKKEYGDIKDKIRKGLQLKREADALKESEDSAAFKAKCDETKVALREALDALNAMLEPERDENGELPTEYSAYSKDYDRVNTALLDVIKASPF